MSKFLIYLSAANPNMSSITTPVYRMQKLQESALVYVSGYPPTCKLDYLGSISIHGRHYFNVWRRYNNVYEIVFEDYQGDLHFHKDHTVFQSIQRLLCLMDDQMGGLRVISTFSFKHNGSPAISDSFLDMHWSAIQGNWQGLMMNLGGILDYHSVGPDSTSHQAVNTEHAPNNMEAVHARLDEQDEIIKYCRRGVSHIRDDMNEANKELHARLDKQDDEIDYCLRSVENVEHDVREVREELQTPNPKNTIHIPDAPEKALRCIPYRRDGVKRQRLSDRFTDQEHKLTVEFSEIKDEEDDEDDEGDEDDEELDQYYEDTEEEDDYMELRSGQKYYK